MELTYTIKDGYRLPDLLPPQEPETALGKYGLLRRRYLKEHRKVLFTNLLTSGRLNEHLAEIDRTARQRVEQTVTAMAQAEGVTDDGEDIPLIVLPVFLRKLRRDALKLVREPSFSVHTVAAFQHGAYRVRVFRPVFPQVAALWKFSAARVRHIEHIPKPRPFAAAVDEGDALGAPADIPAHLFVPEVVLRAGGGVRTLGVDHDLLGVGVFVL